MWINSVYLHCAREELLENRDAGLGSDTVNFALRNSIRVIVRELATDRDNSRVLRAKLKNVLEQD